VGCASDAVLNEAQAELFLISKLLVVVLKMIRPVAGLAMASRSVVVKRGGNNPLVVLLTSSCAEAAGLFVPIPTCACISTVVSKKRQVEKTDLGVAVILVGILYHLECEYKGYLWRYEIFRNRLMPTANPSQYPSNSVQQRAH
jgi:hypothetical protein